MKVNAVRLAFEHLRIRAGMPIFFFMTFATKRSHGYSRRVSMSLKSTISGHRELKVLQRYTNLRAADLAAKLG
jgi:hypothetical protein